MFFDKLITSGNKKNNKVSESAILKEVALHYGAFGERNPFFIRRYITMYLLILTVERLYRILRSSLCGKRKREQKKSFTGGRIIRPDGYFVGGHFFTAKDAFSVWTILSKHLSFVWLCGSSIKRGTRRIMPPDELSFAILFEWRTKRSSSFA